MTAGAADSAQFGLDARRLEPWLLFQFAVGVSFLMVKRKVSQSVRAIKPAAEEGASDAAARMERLMKIKKELSRKVTLAQRCHQQHPSQALPQLRYSAHVRSPASHP